MNKEKEIQLLEEFLEPFKEIAICSWIKELFYIASIASPSNLEIVEGLIEFSKSETGIRFMVSLGGCLRHLNDMLEAVGGEEFLEQKEQLDTWIESLIKKDMN